MLQQNNIYHELWNPQILKIRRPSRLFSIKPVAVGTPYTESLSSYLTRLAQEHCVTPQKLIMGEIAPIIISDRYKSETIANNVSSLFGNSDAKPAINGMKEMTRSLVDALENLTLRQDLRYLSCVSWKGIISDRSLFRHDKAWCPLCFEARRQEEKPIYEPLLWSFREVGFCPEHQCELCDRCPHCDSFQKAIANNSRLGFCSRCKSWLGNELEKKSDRFENYLNKIEGIGDLIAITPSLKFPPTLSDLIRKLQLIQFCFERVVNRDLTQFIAVGKIMEQLKITLTQHYNKPLNLIKLLIPVCNCAKISISQLLSQNFQTLSTTLSNNLEINYRL